MHVKQYEKVHSSKQTNIHNKAAGLEMHQHTRPLNKDRTAARRGLQQEFLQTGLPVQDRWVRTTVPSITVFTSI